MIKLKQPSLALHSFDVPGHKYKMDFTVKLPSTATVYNVVTSILLYAQKTSQNYLENVVINCHGSPGRLHIGENTIINHQNIGCMRLLSFSEQKVGTIWIVACQAAGKRNQIVKLGSYFCSKLAQNAGCFVVAADKFQYVNPGLYIKFCPKNAIDNYEGTVYRWDAEGSEQVFKP